MTFSEMIGKYMSNSPSSAYYKSGSEGASYSVPVDGKEEDLLKTPQAKGVGYGSGSVSPVKGYKPTDSTQDPRYVKPRYSN